MIDWKKKYERAHSWINFLSWIIVLIFIIAMASKFTMAWIALFVCLILLIYLGLSQIIFHLGDEFENISVKLFTMHKDNYIESQSMKNNIYDFRLLIERHLKNIEDEWEKMKHDLKRRRKRNPGKK